MEQGFSIKPKEMELEKADKYIGSDFTRAKNTAEMLEKKYPGWLWAVHTMDGVVVVKSMRLSGNWGFVLHQDKIDNDYKAVMRAGGELLERFRMSRKKFNQEKYLSDLKMDYKGSLNGDYS